MSEKKIHWSGGLEIPINKNSGWSTRLPGHAVCCSGHRAMAIRITGNQEHFDPEKVTCKRCIELLKKANLL